MSLEPLTSSSRPPGRYRFQGPLSLSALLAEARSAGWAAVAVDGRRMRHRDGLFDQFAVALEFPSWFGRNWDAFADCLQDLSWLPAPGYVVLWRRASAADPSVREVADEIIDQAIEARASMRLAPLYLVYAGSRVGPSGDAASRLRRVH